MELKEIGIIHSVYENRNQAPRQGSLSKKESTIEVYPEFAKALSRIEELSHIIVLYWADRANRTTLESIPPWGEDLYGVFSTRSPHRPNPILFSVCQVVSIENNYIIVRGLEALDKSPLLDIKAYSSNLDSYPEAVSHRKTNKE